MTFSRLESAEGKELKSLQEWCRKYEGLMIPSASQYAQGRLELPIRLKVSLGKKPAPAAPVGKVIDKITGLVEEIGEKLLPGFHQGLVLKYPPGTQIGLHRDAPAYAVNKGKGLAASINVIGECTFFVSEKQNDEVHRYFLREGDCCQFDNKQPHGVDVLQVERWVICFFHLKPEFLLQTLQVAKLEKPKVESYTQLSLFDKPEANKKQNSEVAVDLSDYDLDKYQIEVAKTTVISDSRYIDRVRSLTCDWTPEPGMRVYVETDKKEGVIISKNLVKNADAIGKGVILVHPPQFPGLAGLRVKYDDGTEESIYASQAIPLEKLVEEEV